MIVTVTANPAVDVTYRVRDLAWGAALRVRSVHRQAGGKGGNVARILTSMGVGALAVAPVGGAAGEEIRDDLERAGIAHDLIAVSAASRQTVTALAARPDVVKPDEAELAAFSGSACDSPASVLDACERLLEAGAGAVVASRGERGALVLSADVAGWVEPEEVERQREAVAVVPADKSEQVAESR